MINTTLIVATPDERYADFEDALKTQCAKNTHNDVHIIFLRSLNINFCTGCWDCWVKTPGLCPIKDDMPLILSEIMKSDKVIFVSPVSMDFIPALLKKTCDRLIPLVHPYIEIYKNEFHHRNRYPSYPTIGLILIDPEKDNDRFEVIRDVFARLSINLKTKFPPALMISPNYEECEYAIFND